MPNTIRMSWPYPSFQKDPWYEEIAELFSQQDASVYATREDRNLVLLEGGLVEWNAGTGVLEWDANLYANASITGYLWRLAAGNVTLADGEVFYVDLARAPTAGTEVTPQVANKVPSTDAAIMMAIRKGDRIFWRNGSIMNSGDSLTLFESSSAIGVSGKERCFALNETVDGLTLVKGLGGVPFTPASGATHTFLAVLSVSNALLTGTVKLYNVTDAEFVAAVNLTTSSTTSVKVSAALTVGAAAGLLKPTEKVYQVWIENDGVGPVDVTYLGSAYILTE